MIVLVTGGMRSGKSSYVENRLMDADAILYIATGFITDDEMKERVRSHQKRRGERYHTHEGHKNLGQVIGKAKEKVVMLECMGTMVTNLIFDYCPDIERATTKDIKKLERSIMDNIEDIISNAKDKDLYLVTNEVGMGLVSEYKLGRVFTDILGRVNQKIAKEASEVIMMVSGYPLIVK